jgi:tetratricopeptide (TPR) repeat protein
MIGQTLSHYEILDRLGAGGMGEVYRARDTKLGREVALKVLPSRAATHPGLRERFNQEAQTIASLNHPNIVTIHSIESAGDVHFLTMEIVRGSTLTEILENGPLGLDEFFAIAVPLVRALQAAHGRDITHRDIKPDNVMVTGDGQVKLLDFGIAKITESVFEAAHRTAPLLTQAGQVVGTVPYMSPEQVQGKPVDARSDIFSLGIVLYEMLAGANPFRGASAAEIASAILRDVPGPIAGLGEGLFACVLQCLEKDPEKRWESMAGLAARLSALRPGTNTPGPGTDGGPGTAVAPLLKQGAWREAFALLSEAGAARTLSPEDYETLSEAAFWLSKMDVCIQALEAAYSGYVKEAKTERAASIAIRLAEYQFLLHFPAVGNGWLRKAERLLASIPESVTHGYLLRAKTKIAFDVERDGERGWEWAGKTMEAARRYGDRDLECLALQDQGRIQVARGNVTEGMALLDEAMAAAIGGEVRPRTVGITYCNMISTCKTMADYRRAAEWSTSGEQWCRSYSDSVFPGICQVNRAEILRLRGAWEDAETQILNTCRQIGESHLVSEEAFYELGEIRLRRGDYAEAEEAFQKAHRLGRDPIPGLALLRHLQGKHEAAWKMLDRALKHDITAPLGRVRILPCYLEISIAAERLDAARAAADELDTIAARFPSPVFAATAAHARGLLALKASQRDEGMGMLRRAIKIWRDCEMPYEEAKSRMLLGEAYRKDGSVEDAELEWSAARAHFDALGAAPDLRMLETLQAGAY